MSGAAVSGTDSEPEDFPRFVVPGRASFPELLPIRVTYKKSDAFLGLDPVKPDFHKSVA